MDRGSLEPLVEQQQLDWRGTPEGHSGRPSLPGWRLEPHDAQAATTLENCYNREDLSPEWRKYLIASIGPAEYTSPPGSRLLKFLQHVSKNDRAAKVKATAAQAETPLSGRVTAK